jgi:hypothetical protein
VLEARADRRVLDRKYVIAHSLSRYLAASRRFVRLVDGVVSDNLGVRGPFEPWSSIEVPRQRPADSRTREVALLIVNAQTTPDEQWDELDLLPSLFAILDAATSAQVNRYNFETIELVRSRFETWNAKTAGWRPPENFSVIETSFVDVADQNERAYLNGLATSLELDEASVTRLRRAARAALRNSPGFQRLLERLGHPGEYGDVEAQR